MVVSPPSNSPQLELLVSSSGRIRLNPDPEGDWLSHVFGATGPQGCQPQSHHLASISLFTQFLQTLYMQPEAPVQLTRERTQTKLERGPNESVQWERTCIHKYNTYTTWWGWMGAVLQPTPLPQGRRHLRTKYLRCSQPEASIHPTYIFIVYTPENLLLLL